MRETSNYKLSQWDKTDRIEMEDFNEDNQKIDAALAGLAEQVGDKPSKAELAATQKWVKIGEATLAASAIQIDVTVPDVEQYAFLFLLFDVSGCPEMGLMWTGMSEYAVIANDGTNALNRCCGRITVVPLKNGGIMVHSRCYTLPKGSDRNNFFTQIKAAASGTITVSVTGKNRDGEIGPLAAGSQLMVCGLKKP